MDLALVAGGLMAKLVAGEIQHLKTLIVIFFVQLFNSLILRGEAAAGGGVHNEQHLVLQISQVQHGTLAGLHGKIINAHGETSF